MNHIKKHNTGYLLALFFVLVSGAGCLVPNQFWLIVATFASASVVTKIEKWFEKK